MTSRHRITPNLDLTNSPEGVTDLTMQRIVISALILLATMSPAASAQDAPDSPAPSEAPAASAREEEAGLAKFMQSLTFLKGPQQLLKNSVTLNLPEGYTFLAPADAKKVLIDLWGNPPEVASDTLGMILPPGTQLAAEESWAVIVSYEDSGYVSDEDAAKTDYDDLLKTMKEGSIESNKVRKEKGYPSLTLVGWALPPIYDSSRKVLYWAQELAREQSPDHSVNYDVRILGRKGVLSLNCIASMKQLDEVKSHAPEIAAIAQFNDGHRYADFDPSADKKAAYGIAGLIAGSALAAKTGLFKGLFLALMAGKKFVIIGVIALAAFLKKFINRKDS
jgi:uncharacterized membrane-anchored protein